MQKETLSRLDHQSMDDPKGAEADQGRQVFQVEALAVDQLHGVVEVLAVLADVEDRHDVGVVQPRRRPRLALEADLRRAVAAARRRSRPQTPPSQAPPTEVRHGAVVSWACGASVLNTLSVPFGIGLGGG